VFAGVVDDLQHHHPRLDEVPVPGPQAGPGLRRGLVAGERKQRLAALPANFAEIGEFEGDLGPGFDRQGQECQVALLRADEVDQGLADAAQGGRSGLGIQLLVAQGGSPWFCAARSGA